MATQVTIDGENYWMLTKDVAELAATEPVNVVRLLPVSVEIEPFGKLPRWTREHIAAQAERLAAFLVGELTLTIQR